METSPRSLEITVVSGEDLRINGKPIKKNAFVVVRTDVNEYRMTKYDSEGGSYPTWNERVTINLPMHARFITVEVYCKKSSVNKLVAFARVPVSDFTGGYTPENYLHCLSYRLRDAKEERNGIINITVRANVSKSSYGCSTKARMGIPSVGYASNFGGVVTGIPVSCGYRS